MKNPKSKIVAVLCAFAALLFTSGCDSLSNTQVSAQANGNTNTDDVTIAAQASTDINSNVTVGATGTYDINTGDYTAGFIVTLKQAPERPLLDAFRAAGAVRNSDTLWVLPHQLRARDGSVDVASPVFLALRAAGSAPGGAEVFAFTKTRLP